MKKSAPGIAKRLQDIQGAVTLRAFAAKIGIGQSTLHNYLKGRMPKADFIQQVCSEYGVSYEWLISGKGHKYSADVSETEPYLKPCPFCGSKKVYISDVLENDGDEDKTFYKVGCGRIGGACYANSGHFASKERAYDHWNRRV